MLFAINVPQSKSVSIAFISLKSMVFGLIATVTAGQLANPQVCSQSARSFPSLLEVLFLVGMIIDLFAVGYFYFSREFKRIEYYVFYIFHLIISFISIFGALSYIGGQAICQDSTPIYISVLASAILLQVSILVTMISNLFIVLKFLHFGSNIVWLFIWVGGIECARFDSDMVVTIHSLLSLVNIITLFLYRIYGKTLGIVRFWKTLCVASLFLMLFCYLVVLIGADSPGNCHEGRFFTKLYLRYGLFELVSPLLAILFVRNESGDPRQMRIKRHNEVFTNLKEHQFVDFGAKI